MLCPVAKNCNIKIEKKLATGKDSPRLDGIQHVLTDRINNQHKNRDHEYKLNELRFLNVACMTLPTALFLLPPSTLLVGAPRGVSRHPAKTRRTGP